MSSLLLLSVSYFMKILSSFLSSLRSGYNHVMILYYILYYTILYYTIL